MGCSFIAMATAAAGGASTTLNASSALNVADGDLLVCWTKCEGGNTTLACAKNTGSPANTFTFDAGDKLLHSNGDVVGSFGYLLSASADASATFRVTYGASRSFRRLFVLQFRPDSGATVTKDDSNIGQGSSDNTLESGTIDTTGTDEVVVAGYADYSTAQTQSEQINGVNATEPTGSPTGDASVWYRILTATFTGGQATANLGGATEDWLCGIIAFKAEAGGGGATAVPVFYMHRTTQGMS